MFQNIIALPINGKAWKTFWNNQDASHHSQKNWSPSDFALSSAFGSSEIKALVASPRQNDIQIGGWTQGATHVVFNPLWWKRGNYIVSKITWHLLWSPRTACAKVTLGWRCYKRSVPENYPHWSSLTFQLFFMKPLHPSLQQQVVGTSDKLVLCAANWTNRSHETRDPWGSCRVPTQCRRWGQSQIGKWRNFWPLVQPKGLVGNQQLKPKTQTSTLALFKLVGKCWTSCVDILWKTVFKPSAQHLFYPQMVKGCSQVTKISSLNVLGSKLIRVKLLTQWAGSLKRPMRQRTGLRHLGHRNQSTNTTASRREGDKTLNAERAQEWVSAGNGCSKTNTVSTSI